MGPVVTTRSPSRVAGPRSDEAIGGGALVAVAVGAAVAVAVGAAVAVAVGAAVAVGTSVALRPRESLAVALGVGSWVNTFIVTVSDASLEALALASALGVTSTGSGLGGGTTFTQPITRPRIAELSARARPMRMAGELSSRDRG